jgi:DNA invertase Pin-like site-specific DNA recombinase
MRAALYARVSSLRQRTRQTIDAQLAVLPDYAREMGWMVAGTYIDDGKSAKTGKLADRTGFARLVADCQAGHFDVVVVVSIDRLTRSEDHGERGAIIGAFQKSNVQIAVVGAGIQDLSTFAGDSYVSMQALLAAEENRKRKMRAIGGKLVAIARGHKPAGRTPYGLHFDPVARAWSIDEPAAALVREAFRRVAAGEGTTTIAADLTERGIPGRPEATWTAIRIWKFIQAPLYRGEWMADKKRRLTIKVPAIVTEAEWTAARDALLAHGKRGRARSRHTYLLAGLAVCGRCGAPIGVATGDLRWSGRNGASAGATPARYVCCRRRRPDRGAERCGLPYRETADVDGRLWSALERLILSGDRLERAARLKESEAGTDDAVWAADLTSARSRLARLSSTEAALLARFRRGSISEAAMDGELEAISRERRMLEMQAETAMRGRSAATRLRARSGAALDLIADLRCRIATATPEDRQRYVASMIDPRSAVLDDSGRISARIRVCRIDPGARTEEWPTHLELRLVA